MKTVNGIAYEYRPGISDKPVIIFLHGLSSNHTTWATAVRAAQTAGYGTLAPDLRGHGDSDKSRRRSHYTIGTMSDDLKQIVEAERLGRLVIVGYSFGGYVGLDYAVRYPAGLVGLVLISANHVSPLRYRSLGFLSPVVRRVIEGIGWLLLWQKRQRYYYFEPQSAKTRGYWRSTLSGYGTMPLSINFWMLSEAFGLDFADSIERIVCPTLIIRGEGDTFVTEAEVADMLKRLPHARAMTLGTGHYVASHLEDETASRVVRFADSLV